MILLCCNIYACSLCNRFVIFRRKGRGFDGSGMEREEGDYDRIDVTEEGTPGPQRSIEVSQSILTC